MSESIKIVLMDWELIGGFFGGGRKTTQKAEKERERHYIDRSSMAFCVNCHVKEKSRFQRLSQHFCTFRIYAITNVCLIPLPLLGWFFSGNQFVFGGNGG